MEIRPMTRKNTARIDIEDTSDLDGISLGETCCFKVYGKVRSMSGPEKYDYGKDDKGSYPGSVEIELDRIEAEPRGEFDGMMED